MKETSSTTTIANTKFANIANIITTNNN
jgi:hypothetical protein